MLSYSWQSKPGGPPSRTTEPQASRMLDAGCAQQPRDSLKGELEWGDPGRRGALPRAEQVSGAHGAGCVVAVLHRWAQVCVVGSQVVMGGGKEEVGAREPVAP